MNIRHSSPRGTSSIPTTATRSTLALLTAFLAAGCSGQVAIDVDRATTYQTIEGWSATVEVGDSDWPQAEVERHRDDVLDWLVDSVGVNRLRLAVKSGYEHPEDLAPAFFADNSRRRPWVQRWFQIVNDNEDPLVADPNGFQFFFLDHLMETVVLPVRERLEAKGKSLYVNLNYVDFGDSPFEHRDDPAEFAEYMSVMFDHLEREHGLVPDGIEINEPDNDAYWTAEDVARGFVAVGERLENEGYAPDFIGPETITVARAIEYFDEMTTVPGLDRYLTHLSYHTYGEKRPEDLRRVAELAEEWGLRTSMLEYMDGTHEDLHNDLTLANVSAWEKFGIMTYVRPDSTGRIGFVGDSKLVSEYFRNIDRGAVRVAAESSEEDIAPVAFLNPDGEAVLIVRAPSTRTLVMSGLPAGTVDAHLTTYQDLRTVPVTPARTEAGLLSLTLPVPGLLVIRIDSAEQ